MDNSTILDSIRLAGTNDYQQRIPSASQAGVEKVFKTLMSPMNNTLYNEFVSGLINLVGTQIIRSKQWINPLAKFKRVNLYQKQTIQEIGFELIKAKGFNLKDNDLFEENDPRVKTAYHSMNRQDRYDITFNPELLERAFLTPNGLSDFMAGVMQVPINSDNYDEYNIMKNLIAKYASEYRFYNIQIPALDDNADEAALKQFLEKVRATTGQLKFLKSQYNYYNIPTFTMPENTLLITTPEVAAKIDVNVLAGAFNVSFAEMQNKIIVIDEMPIANCYAILVDEDWFVCGDNLYRTDSFYNGKSLSTNYYLHHWETLSVSPFMNAIMFSTAATTNLPVVTVTPSAYDAALVDENGVAMNNISLSTDTYIKGALAMGVVPANKNVGTVFAPSTFEITDISRAVAATALATVTGDITGATVVTATFAAKVEDVSGTYVFTYNAATPGWELESAAVTLSQYGITVAGTPAASNTITVVFAAASTLHPVINSRTYVDRVDKIHLQAAVIAGDVVTIKASTTYNSDGVGATAFSSVVKQFTVAV